MLELCIAIITNEEMKKDLGRQSPNQYFLCNECKTNKSKTSIVLLKCKCQFCLNCFKKYILNHFLSKGFKTISDSNEKDKFYSICYCVDHKAIIPLNLLTKIFSFKELDFLQFKSLERLQKEISNRKIILDQKLLKFCSICSKMSDPESSYSICKSNHICCRFCLSKITPVLMNNKSENCKFPDCNNFIEVRRQVPKSHYSNI